MGLSRRKMLGVAAGGAVAGPRIMQQAMSDVGASNLGPPTTPYPCAQVQAKQSETLEYLAKLKRVAAGDIRDEDRDYPTEGGGCPFEPLLSASNSAKRFMRTRRDERRRRERVIKSALDALDHYDKTGILRTFF
jgi:hypothetical protein